MSLRTVRPTSSFGSLVNDPAVTNAYANVDEGVDANDGMASWSGQDAIGGVTENFYIPHLANLRRASSVTMRYAYTADAAGNCVFTPVIATSPTSFESNVITYGAGSGSPGFPAMIKDSHTWHGPWSRNDLGDLYMAITITVVKGGSIMVSAVELQIDNCRFRRNPKANPRRRRGSHCINAR